MISTYGSHVRDIGVAVGSDFGRLLREARLSLGLAQEDIWTNTPVSKATYGRWERGEIDEPEPRHVRAVCAYLKINPVVAYIALGWLTRDELSAYAQPSDFDHAETVSDIVAILRDRQLPAAQRAALGHALNAALGLWTSAMSMPEPKEPSRADLDRAAQRKSRTP